MGSSAVEMEVDEFMAEDVSFVVGLRRVAKPK
jgi:hypothetical protein